MKSCIPGAQPGLGDLQCAGLSTRQGQQAASWDCLEARTCLLLVLCRGGVPTQSPAVGLPKTIYGK